MATHLSNSRRLVAGHSRLRESVRKDFAAVKNASENAGPLKRFERFISPYLAANALPSEDLFDSLIKRNSWLR